MWRWLFGERCSVGKNRPIEKSVYSPPEIDFELDKYRKMCSEPVLSFVDTYYSDRKRFIVDVTHSGDDTRHKDLYILTCHDLFENICFKVEFLHLYGRDRVSDHLQNDRIMLPEVVEPFPTYMYGVINERYQDLTFLTSQERQYLFRLICVELEREMKYKSLKEQRSKRKENTLKERQRQKLTNIYKKETL